MYREDSGSRFFRTVGIPYMRNDPEDHNVKSRRCENVKSHRAGPLLTKVLSDFVQSIDLVSVKTPHSFFP